MSLCSDFRSVIFDSTRKTTRGSETLKTWPFLDSPHRSRGLRPRWGRRGGRPQEPLASAAGAPSPSPRWLRPAVKIHKSTWSSRLSFRDVSKLQKYFHQRHYRDNIVRDWPGRGWVQRRSPGWGTLGRIRWGIPPGRRHELQRRSAVPSDHSCLPEGHKKGGVTQGKLILHRIETEIHVPFLHLFFLYIFFYINKHTHRHTHINIYLKSSDINLVNKSKIRPEIKKNVPTDDTLLEYKPRIVSLLWSDWMPEYVQRQ